MGLVLFFLYPDWFTKEAISSFIKENSSNIFWAYLGISIVRGIFLLPSTPFVLAGILIFTESPWTVFWISMLGIMVTAAYLYCASKFLEFDKLFGDKLKSKSDKITEKLNKYGFWIVLAWSFFPLVPTDLICYIAGSIRMNFFKYFSAIFIGEAVLFGIYVFLGESILG
jgi:uncharacterized membrane protein YdjX (TVP38/TMEM64 family)